MSNGATVHPISKTARTSSLFADLPDVMSVPRVSDALGVTKQTVYAEISRGRLGCVHVGSRLRVTRTQLLQYVGEVC